MIDEDLIRQPSPTEVEDFMSTPARLTLIFTIVAIFSTSRAAELDKRKLLEAQDFWVNRDFAWYEAHIPFFECPDPEIQTTYYYRWELVTRHLTYGSPETGTTITEFSNRPFWSGRYGAIVCPAGHQLYEVRWLRDPVHARDYLRYWLHTPGAEPRRYSSWLADCTRAVHLVHPDDAFTTGLLPELLEHHESWKRARWVEEVGLYWQLGHDDGMEFDINARQTRDVFRGGQSLRPSFNAYMWADLRALADIADLAGKKELAARFRAEAERLRQTVEERLWDPGREFFFPMSNQRHEKDGHVVEKHTLTYQTGPFAGSPHGRELHGYVPWAFGLPGPGYEAAWKFLMDPEYFQAPFGPTTVERNDPQFVLKDTCCWWSGHSWPFATTQTLVALARVLHDYEQEHVTRDDYLELLHTYAISHRKDGRPYIAEALHPFTGSWKGHDYENRSEHYFHSGFVDPVITGLVGLRPGEGLEFTVDPLAPATWPYFALDDVPYKGHLLAILWDRDGTRYDHGPGLHVLVNGKRVASSEKLERLEVRLPSIVPVPRKVKRDFNYAVNNDGDYYPRYRASHVARGTSLAFLHDGQVRYDVRPVNRWTAAGSPRAVDHVEVDLGQVRKLTSVKLYFLDDGKGVAPPRSVKLLHTTSTDDDWKPVPGARQSPERPLGRRPTEIRFPEIGIRRLRVELEHDGETRAGLTEIEAWGPGTLPYRAPPPPPGNIAYNRSSEGYPRASASHHDRYGGTPDKAIDGRVNYQPSPVNRWTSYGSPRESDWLEVDFGQPRSFRRVELLIYDDRGGVQPPRAIAIEAWKDGAWHLVENAVAEPATPEGNRSNTIRFDPVTASKVRAVFTHAGKARSGVTEFEVWER